jgi:catechol 2,3-dioxygenase-like lactoylglutathione lyase family enzyme
MITREFAEAFTKEWIRAWNAHDLDAILAHYADDFELTSPFIAAIASSPSGSLKGKPAIGAYWARALARFPDLHFISLGVHVGVNSVVLRYRSVMDTTACETFEFNADAKVQRAIAHYDQPDLAKANQKHTWFYAAHVTPILNVSDVRASFAWFEKLGWRTCWGWASSGNPSDPPTFGAVGAGQVEIFLCLDGQGGRGRGTNQSTSGGADGDDTMDKGAWLSVWVPDVDAVHARCQREGLDVTHPPTNEPWGVREMHVRHPDGHVLRISRSISH